MINEATSVYATRMGNRIHQPRYSPVLAGGRRLRSNCVRVRFYPSDLRVVRCGAMMTSSMTSRRSISSEGARWSLCRRRNTSADDDVCGVAAGAVAGDVGDFVCRPPPGTASPGRPEPSRSPPPARRLTDVRTRRSRRRRRVDGRPRRPSPGRPGRRW